MPWKWIARNCPCFLSLILSGLLLSCLFCFCKEGHDTRLLLLHPHPFSPHPTWSQFKMDYLETDHKSNLKSSMQSSASFDSTLTLLETFHSTPPPHRCSWLFQCRHKRLLHFLLICLSSKEVASIKCMPCSPCQWNRQSTYTILMMPLPPWQMSVLIAY